MFFTILGISEYTSAQLLQNKKQFTKQDSLRGSITPERAWWNLERYDLFVAVDIDNKFIQGTNTITYSVLESQQRMQIDLQEPMKITRVTDGNGALDFERDGNVYYITLSETPQKGTQDSITIEFEGNPKPAKRAPWDGGFSWKKDAQGRPFIATSNQGLGASVWWPCKDHMYDEPEDGMTIAVNVPDDLMNVSNGRLIGTEKLEDATTTYTWEVMNPINNYGVNINIGHYAHFSEVYDGEKGPLDMDYYVLDYNLEKAKNHFKDAPKMMKAFEHWFGPYPFYEDSFKLVEAPYLGMEHQSSVTYGNRYVNGYLGSDLSGTGWGMKFDFIIIHEAGHEWFANSITNKDIADMWIHESFTAYSESLFLDYHYGTTAANEYVIGTRRSILNDRPLIGHYDVNHEGSGDMYYKGANMIHTLRQVVNDDEKWRDILRDMNKTFYHKTVTTQEIESFLSKAIGVDLTGFFNQYLRDVRIPELVLGQKRRSLTYYWKNTVADFNLPIRITVDGKRVLLQPSHKKQSIRLPSKKSIITTDMNYYVGYTIK